MQLFIVRVARESDHVAAVEEWWGDGVECIGRTVEKNWRKIDQHLIFTYIESDVLFRIVYLEQGCRRIAVIV